MAISDAELASIDVASQELYEQGVPHEAFRFLREHDPVHWHPWDWQGGGFWALTKHADVVAVSKDSATFSSAAGHIYLWDLEPDALEARRSLIETDPPDHSRLRRIVSSAFTPKKVKDYEAYTREIASTLLDGVVSKGDFDWVEGIAAPLPINVVVSILGIADEDAPMMVELSNHLAEGTSDIPLDPSAYGNTTPLRLLPFNSPASWALFEYARRIGEERRKNPRDDLVSRLVHAEVDGDRLTDAEYTNFFQLMVFAGNETTRTAISQGMLALMEHPEQMDRIVEDPALIPTAVEELIRWASPVMYFRRTATRDTELRGVPIRAGDKVVMWYISANYDEEVFADPYRLDVARIPNDEVSFGGGGAHYCLGAFLARLEITILLEEMLARRIRFRLAGRPRRLRSNFVNGIASMPVSVVRG
jgi:cholest-4-en-3-one 26-monooxygenase